METYPTLNVWQRRRGSVWKKTKPAHDGPLLHLCSKPGVAGSSSPGHFVTAYLDERGSRILAAHVHGQVYLLDLIQNRFWLVSRTKYCPTACSLTPLSDRDVLVATSDRQIQVYRSSNCSQVGQLKGHQTCVSHLSTDPEGYVALSTSLERTCIWDLNQLSLRHNIALPFHLDLVKSLLIPPREDMVSVFKNNLVLRWDSNKDKYMSQLKPLPSLQKLIIVTADVSSDGRYLAVGGRSRFVLLWSLEDLESQPRALSVGEESSSLRQVQFVNWEVAANSANCVQTLALAVLTHKGTLKVYDFVTGTLLFRGRQEISQLHAAKRGSRVVTITGSGDIQLYQLGLTLAPRHTRPRKIIKGKCIASSIPLSAATLCKLKGLVQEQGQFPEKYRVLIWKNFLQLAENVKAFQKLYDREHHPTTCDLKDQYPLQDTTLLRSLQRTLSLVYFWCPRLTEVGLMADLSFPFIKLFHPNQMFVLEVIITFMINWGRNWFWNYPRPPFAILSLTEELLIHHDRSLLLHFVRHGITPEVYCWSLLRSLFSQVVPREDWLAIFDHLFCNPLDFIFYLVVAFNVTTRSRLLALSETSQIEGLYHVQSGVCVRNWLKKCHQLRELTPPELRERISEVAGKFQSITREEYPVFKNFPEFVLDLKEEEHETHQEIEYLKRRQSVFLEGQANYLDQQKSNNIAQAAPIAGVKESLLDHSSTVRKVLSLRSKSIYH